MVFSSTTFLLAFLPRMADRVLTKITSVTLLVLAKSTTLPL